MTKLKQYLVAINGASRKHLFPPALLPKRQPLWTQETLVLKCLYHGGGRCCLCFTIDVIYKRKRKLFLDVKLIVVSLVIVTTNLSSLPFCLYCCFPLVLNLLAAIRRLHFCRQTGLKPGCSVTHFRVMLGETSCCTRSLSRDSPQHSNSLQQ